MSNMPPLPARRDPAVDAVKTLAMIAVVSIHACSCFMRVGVWSLSSILYDLSLVAIPLFFMASGYILLARPVTDATPAYALRKLWRIVRFMVIFLVVTYLVWNLFGENPPTLSEIFCNIVFQDQIYWIWFLTALAIVYLLYPLISRLWHTKTGPAWLIGASVLIMSAAYVANLIDVRSMPDFRLPLCCRVWYWVGYFVLGGAMHKLTLSRGVAMAGTALFAAAWVYVAHLSHIASAINFGEYFYGCPVLMLLCVNIFQVATGAVKTPSRALDAVSTLFMPVFMLHPFVLTYLAHAFPWTLPGACIGLTVSTLLITAAISWLITRIRLVRRFFSL